MSTPMEQQPQAARLIGVFQFAAALFSFLIASAAVLSGDAAPLGAQKPARYWRLNGIVRDSTAGPIAGATVTIYGATGSATTDERGRFALDSVPEGTRVVQVIALGFKPRLVAVGIEEHTPTVTVRLAKIDVILDSVRVMAVKRPEDMPHRRRDIIEAKEFAHPEIVSGTALDALFLLRPQIFTGRPSGGTNPTTEAAQRSQFYPREVIGDEKTGQRVVCAAGRVCDIDQRLSVSINGGPVGSPDILSALPARIVREMRYLLPADAAARFGQTAGGGPVLIVYTK